MKRKPVVPREQALRDVEDAVGYYLNEGSESAAIGFIDALEEAYNDIGRRPALGSPRYSIELNLPGLRAWPLKRYRYPQIVFHIEQADHIDVWRVLHGHSDVPAWLREPDGG